MDKSNKHFKAISLLIGVLFILLISILSFRAGMFVGQNQVNYYSSWRAAYGRNLDKGSILTPFMPGPGDRINPNGVVGKIVSVNYPQILIKGENSAERIILLGTSTNIRTIHRDASTSSLQIGDSVVIIGKPQNDGQLRADFIRLLPPRY